MVHINYKPGPCQLCTWSIVNWPEESSFMDHVGPHIDNVPGLFRMDLVHPSYVFSSFSLCSSMLHLTKGVKCSLVYAIYDVSAYTDDGIQMHAKK
jgi:hypothetical protein